MRVVSVELIRARLPFHAPFRISLAESDGTENLFVRLRSDAGVEGVGEASPSPAITGETAESLVETGRSLAPLMLEVDPSDLEGLSRMMASEFPRQPTIRSGFDMALHDLAARTADLPLFRFLGGARRTFQTDNTVGLNTPETMAATAEGFVGEGFGAIKAKVGLDVDTDVQRVLAIRQAIGPDIPIRIDANQGWDRAEAIDVLGRLAGCGVEYCEQPVARTDLDGLRIVRESTSVPIMADESVFDDRDALALVRGECCDYLNIKLSKSGGIRTAMRIAAIAASADVSCMLGCMSETRLGLSAAAHLISAYPVIRYADLDSHVDHITDPVLGGMRIQGGMVHLPEGPGHGARLDPDFVAACPVEIFTA